MTPAEKAARLLELHHAAQPLILVNAWDAGSARMVEQAGFPAIATTSAGVAYALGYADGQNVPWPEMTAAIRRIADAVSVPVTADIEAGFSASLQDAERTIAQLIETGAVGVNLEDALPGHGDHGPLYEVKDQVERIKLVRRAGDQRKLRMFINARTDAYWQRGMEPEQALQATLERGAAYLDAGADCIFVPGLKNPEHIHAVVDRWKSPVNILAGLDTPPIPELARMGVKRISYGSGPMRAGMGLLRRICQEAKIAGTYNSMTQGAVSYDEMQKMFS